MSRKRSPFKNGMRVGNDFEIFILELTRGH